MYIQTCGCHLCFLTALFFPGVWWEVSLKDLAMVVGNLSRNLWVFASSPQRDFKEPGTCLPALMWHSRPDGTQMSKWCFSKGKINSIWQISWKQHAGTTSASATGKGAGERNEARRALGRALSSAGVFLSSFYLFLISLRLRLLKSVRHSEGISWVGSHPLEVAEINTLWKTKLFLGMRTFTHFT